MKKTLLLIGLLALLAVDAAGRGAYRGKKKEGGLT